MAAASSAAPAGPRAARPPSLDEMKQFIIRHEPFMSREVKLQLLQIILMGVGDRVGDEVVVSEAGTPAAPETNVRLDAVGAHNLTHGVSSHVFVVGGAAGPVCVPRLIERVRRARARRLDGAGAGV